jgi:LPS-assembly lipoprotein
MRAIKIMLLGVLAVQLLACGFHLRETASLPTALQPLYIGGKKADGALGQALRVELKSNETAVTYNPGAANYQLLITGEKQDQRIVSLDRRGLVAEYGLITQVEFELRDKGGERVLGPQDVEIRRTIVNNPDNVTTTNEEIRLVRDDMVKSLAGQIVRRLAAYANKPRPPVAAPVQTAPAPTPSDPSMPPAQPK